MSGLKKIVDFINSLLGTPKKVEAPLLNIKYKGINVFYSEGTSLINRIIKDGDYEPEVVTAILKNIENKSNPVIIDIGANIGLISIAVLNEFPQVKIYAFEPGPHQNKLFEKTIIENNLNSIVLSSVALSNKKGTTTFCIHSSNDASGDGFVDTERAGKTNKITVNTDTLDNWWIENNRPTIDFIKMDTEGSEYWILQGAKQFVESQRPNMLIEINLQNIKNYPFTLDDLLKLIDSLGYSVFSMERDLVDSSNSEKHLRKSDTFLLLPKS